MKRILLILELTGIVATMSSCDKWLDLMPNDGTVEGEYWTSKEEAEAVLIGCYTSLLEDKLVQKMFVWGEVRADMLTIGPTITNDFVNVQRGEISPDNGFVAWDEFYGTINQCNKLIGNAAKVRAVDQSFTKKMHDQYVAEAIAIRSLMYFYLVRSFRSVPFVLTASDNDEQDYYISKTDGTVILDSLAAQLRRVLDANALPAEYGDNASNKGKITHYGCMTLLADILLWQEKNDECAELCRQIIRSSKYRLIPVPRAEVIIKDKGGEPLDTTYIVVQADMDRWFDELYIRGNSMESIFEIQFPETHPSHGDPFYYLFNSLPRLIPFADNLESVLFPLYEHSSAIKDIRSSTYQNSYVWKYVGMGLSSTAFAALRPQRSFPHLIVYRLPDVILMLAEALATNPSATEEMRVEAYQLVQEVRARSNAVENVDTELTSPIDTRSLEKLILSERGREFVFEGKRWYDVLRFAKRNSYGGASKSGYEYLTTMAIYSAPPEKAASLQIKYQASEWFHYWPILTSTVEINRNLEQNEFYKYNQ